jgi:hypothetical protein
MFSKQYQNNIKITSKPYQNNIKITSKPYQNNIKITSKYRFGSMETGAT